MVLSLFCRSWYRSTAFIRLCCSRSSTTTLLESLLRRKARNADSCSSRRCIISSKPAFPARAACFAEDIVSAAEDFVLLPILSPCLISLFRRAPFSEALPQRRLFVPDHHPVRPIQAFDAGTLEPDILHPLAAIHAGEVESPVGFDEHVQAHEQTESILLPCVVDKGFVHDHGST